jgi:altronate hydrolase
MAERMADDMDYNAGRLLEGLSWEEASQQLFEQVVETASGKCTRGEQRGLSEQEFVPWQPDASL